MMAYLVRNDISLCKVSGISAKAPKIAPETEVDVDLLICRAVEGPGRSLCSTASGIRHTVVQNEFGMSILASVIGKYLRPRLLSIIQHKTHQLRVTIFAGRARPWRCANWSARLDIGLSPTGKECSEEIPPCDETEDK